MSVTVPPPAEPKKEDNKIGQALLVLGISSLTMCAIVYVILVAFMSWVINNLPMEM